MDVHIGLGSNMGDREANLVAGLDGLRRAGHSVAAVSSVWETEALDGAGPRSFLNLVARLETALEPVELLAVLQRIEREVGRTPEQHRGPRLLDLDLLLAGDRVCDGPELRLPHPRMWQRRFVLAPLGEIDPQLRDPASGRSVIEQERTLRAVQPAVRRVGPLALPRATHL
jgi:2-amino-4-hydroxy-6-hydroxymethyldihydropteridine diphosphokinase